MHALQSRLQGEMGEMRQACAALRGGRDAAEAAGLMAAREALQTKQACAMCCVSTRVLPLRCTFSCALNAVHSVHAVPKLSPRACGVHCMCTVQAALELSLRGLLAAASGDNGDGGSDSTPGGDGGSPGDGTPGGGDAAWREGCEELEELEEQLATLRLQLHIADDVLQQRRQSPRMVETPSPAAASNLCGHPSFPGAHPFAQSYALGLRGEPPPLGSRRERLRRHSGLKPPILSAFGHSGAKTRNPTSMSLRAAPSHTLSS